MLARSSGMAWHGAEIPPIPCNIRSVRPVLPSVHPVGGAVNKDVVNGLPLCRAPQTSVGRSLIGPYPIHVGV
jgi:hypothetical protein